MIMYLEYFEPRPEPVELEVDGVMHLVGAMILDACKCAAAGQAEDLHWLKTEGLEMAEVIGMDIYKIKRWIDAGCNMPSKKRKS